MTVEATSRAKPRRWRRRATPETVSLARVDRRTKNIPSRLQPGEIAVLDHEDLDRVAVEALIEAGVGGVINASRSITGRYPNTGPLLLVQQGIPLLDNVGPDVLDMVDEGDPVTINDDCVEIDGAVVARGTRHTEESLRAELDAARSSLGAELERFAENTLDYIRQEGHLLIDPPPVPEMAVSFKGRHVLIVVRGLDYKDDLQVLRQSGYLGDARPLLVGVDGGADALIEMGYTPDVIIGDFDSVSERALQCGAVLVVHAYVGGEAPGAERLEEMGLEYTSFESVGTSEDIAMLMAFEGGAEAIVAVGTHNSMVEFLDKGRSGMASTFLVRMKVGSLLVDAKGVSRLYQSRVRKRDLIVLVLAAVVTLVLIALVSEPVRVLIRGLSLPYE